MHILLIYFDLLIFNKILLIKILVFLFGTIFNMIDRTGKSLLYLMGVCTRQQS